MRESILADKRGLSPVVASIILCGVVLIIGINVWSFTYSISSVLQSDYYEGVKKQIDIISERFAVAHIAYNSIDYTLRVWVYNYGNVSLNVDVYVFINGGINGRNTGGISVSRKEFVEITVPIGVLGVGTELVVEVMSRRQNVVYSTFVVPAS